MPERPSTSALGDAGAVSGAEVRLTSRANGTLGTAVTDADGIARGRLTGNGVSGTFTVDATVDGQTHTFTVTNP